MNTLRNFIRVKCICFIVAISLLNSFCEGKGQIYFDLAENDNFSEINLANVSGFSINVRIMISSPVPEKLHKSFKVLSPKGYRLMGFVKAAQLRKMTDIEEEDEVEDYVPLCRDKLSYEKRDGYQEQICGEVDSYEISRHSQKLVGPRVFRSLRGQLDLQIHTDYYYTLPRNQSKVLAEIVFVSYTDCWRSFDTAKYFIRCSKRDPFSCVKSSLNCDGDIHCLFEDGFAQDEKNCRSGINSNNYEITYSQAVSGSGIVGKNDQKKRVEMAESEYKQMKQYFIPTGFIFFFIWGIITLLRKCYKCYMSEYGKDDLYY